MRISRLATEAELQEIKSYEGACFAKGETGHAPTESLQWYLVEDYPLSRIAFCPDEAWFAAERKMHAEEGRPEMYDDMFSGPIHTPIIVRQDGDLGYIWDGWHRTGASVVLGRTSIIALVGVDPGTIV